MPRLAEEGIVGADAIFACLGSALEIFSCYSRVEKASGEAVTLKEYLKQVWAAVIKEAVAMILTGANTIGFEGDARLTATWLWTLNAGNTDATNGDSAKYDDANDESEGDANKAKGTGFVLEYDAAQGLGARLEDLGSLVEVSCEIARLLAIGERANHLFGKDEGRITTAKKKKGPKMDVFKTLEQANEGSTTFGKTKVERHGKTVLDRIHQTMILRRRPRRSHQTLPCRRRHRQRSAPLAARTGTLRFVSRTPKKNAGSMECWREKRGWDFEARLLTIQTCERKAMSC